MAQARILSKNLLADHTLEFQFFVDGVFEYRPGQWALFDFPLKQPLKRSYSLVSYTQENDHSFMKIVVKLVDGGKASTWFSQAKVGDVLGVSGVFGHFVLQNSASLKVFVGTGTGIASLIAMARATVAPKIIYFSVSYEKELFYHQELFDLGCDETYIHVSRESVNGCEMGRVDLSNPNFPLESEFYLCGSPQSVASFQEQLANRGYKNIFMEKY